MRRLRGTNYLMPREREPDGEFDVGLRLPYLKQKKAPFAYAHVMVRYTLLEKL